MAREFEILNAKINIESGGFDSIQKGLLSLEKSFSSSAKSINQNLSSINLSAADIKIAQTLDGIANQAGKVDQIKARIESLNTDTQPSIQSFLGRLNEIRSGINLAFSGGGIGEAATGIRQSIFGLNASSSILAKGLDFLSNQFVNTSKASSVLGQDAERLALQFRDLNDTASTQLKDFKDLAKQYGVLPAELNGIDASVQKARNEFQRLANVIQSTGEITPGQLAQVRNQTDLVLKHFQDLRLRGVVPLGTEADKVLSVIENEFKSSSLAATNLTAKFNVMNSELKDVSNSSGAVKNNLSKIGSIASTINPLNLAVSGVDGSFKALTKTVSIFKDVFLGTFLGNVLGNLVSNLFFSVQNALSNIPGALVQLASDAAETQNRFEAVFTELTPKAEEFVNTLATDVGRDPFKIKDSLSSFQSFNIGLGFTNDESLKMSETLQRLSLDFASFNNITDADAQQRFIAAMSGSSEVLDKFGINIKEAAIEAESFKLGINKVSANMSEQEKTIARLSIIYKSMSDQGAVGDAIRTADSFANQQKRLQSNLTQTGTVIGSQLLPAIAPFISILNNLLEFVLPSVINKFSGLFTSIQQFSTSLSTIITNTLNGVVDFNSSVSTLIAGLVAVFSGDWNTAWQLFVITISDALSYGLDLLSDFINSGFDWGFSFVEQIASGIMDAAGRILVLAVTTIGNIISSFLEPGSPPKEGPLSSIDKWGKGLVETFNSSLLSTDLSGGLDAKLQQATVNLLKARQDVIDAERSGYVPPELLEKLKLAEQEKTNIEQQIKDQKTLNKEQSKVDTKSSIKKKDSKSSGVSGGKSPQLSNEEKVIKKLDDIEKSKKDLIFKYQNGIITDRKDFLKQMLNLEQDYADVAIKNGISFSVSESASRIKDLETELDSLSKKGEKTKLPKVGFSIEIPDFDATISDNKSNIEKTGLNVGKLLTTSIKSSVDKNFNQVYETLNTKVENIKLELNTKLSTIGEGLKNSLNGIITPIENVFSEVRKNIVGFVQGVSFATTTILLLLGKMKITDLFFGGFPKLIGNAITYLQKFDTVVSLIINTLDFFEKATKFIRPLVTFLGENVVKIFGKLNPITLLISAAIIGVIENIGLLANIFDDLSKRYKQAFNGILDAISKLFSGTGISQSNPLVFIFNYLLYVLDQVLKIFDPINKSIGKIFAGIFQVLSAIEKITVIPVLNLFAAGLSLLQGDFDSFGNYFSIAFENILSGLSDLSLGVLDIITGAFTSLPNFIAQIIESSFNIIGLGFIGTTVASFIRDTFSQFELGINTLKTLLSNLFNGTLDISSLFSAFGLDNIANFFQDKLGNSIILLNQRFQILYNVLSSKLLPIFTLAFNSIKDAVSNSISIISQRLESLQPIFDFILNKISSLFNSETSFNILKGVVVGAIGAIIVIITTLIGVVVGLVDGISYAVKAITNGIELLSTGFSNIFLGITQVILGFSSLISDLFSGNFSNISTDLEVLGDGIYNIFSGLFSSITGLFEISFGSLSNLVVGFISGVIDYFYDLYNELIGHSIIPDMISGIINAITTFKTDFLGIISSLITSTLDFFLGIGKSIITSIITSIQENAGSLLNVFSTLFGGGTTDTTSSNVDTSQAQQILALAQQVFITLTNLTGTLQNTFNGFVSGSLEYFISVANTTLEAFLSLKETLVGENSLIQEISDGTVGILSNMGVSISTVLMSIQSEALLAFKVEKWTSIGRFIVSGIMTGLSEKRNDFLAYVRKLAQAAVDTAADELGIKSPSIKFRELGINSVEGFKEGLSALPPTTGSIANEALDGVSSVFKSFNEVNRKALKKSTLSIFKDNQDTLVGLIAKGGKDAQLAYSKLLSDNDFITKSGINTMDLAKKFIDSFKTSRDLMTKEFINTGTNFVNGILGQQQDVITAFNTTLENVRYQTNSTRNAIEDAFKQPLTDEFLNSLYTSVKNGTTFGEKIDSQIKIAYLSQEKLNASLEDQQKIEEKIKAIQSTQIAIDKITKPVNDITETISKETEALDLLDSLKLGIDATAPEVLDKLSELANDMISKLNSVLKISSPSKVFMSIGQNLGLGLVNGLDSTNKLIPATVQDISNNLTSALKNSTINQNGFALNGINNRNAATANTPVNVSIQNTIGNNMDLAVVEQRILNTITKAVRR